MRFYLYTIFLIIIVSCSFEKNHKHNSESVLFKDVIEKSNDIIIKSSEKYIQLKVDQKLEFELIDKMVIYKETKNNTISYDSINHIINYYFLLSGTNEVLPYYSIKNNVTNFDFYRVFKSDSEYDAVKSFYQLTIKLNDSIVKDKIIMFKNIPLDEYQLFME